LVSTCLPQRSNECIGSHGSLIMTFMAHLVLIVTENPLRGKCLVRAGSGVFSRCGYREGGAVTTRRVKGWGYQPLLIKPYMRFSRIRLSDVLHRVQYVIRQVVVDRSLAFDRAS